MSSWKGEEPMLKRNKRHGRLLVLAVLVVGVGLTAAAPAMAAERTTSESGRSQVSVTPWTLPSEGGVFSFHSLVRARFVLAMRGILHSTVPTAYTPGTVSDDPDPTSDAPVDQPEDPVVIDDPPSGPDRPTTVTTDDTVVDMPSAMSELLFNE